MRKIFLDANVVIDLINAGNRFHTDLLFLFSELTKQKKKLYISPTTFAITYYFLSKHIKSKSKLNEEATAFFAGFIFTREDGVIMNKVFQSDFNDLEDGLQYFSALDADIDAIITYNQHDFAKSAIPVFHPSQYISQFLL